MIIVFTVLPQRALVLLGFGQKQSLVLVLFGGLGVSFEWLLVP